MLRSSRYFYLAIVLICAALLGTGYYLQFARGLEPCPLCIFQRIAYITILIIAAAGLVHGPGKPWLRVYSGLLGIAAVAGIAIAGRQVWLQHLPADQVPACGPGLDYMLEVFSFSETLKMVFSGSGECAEVHWTFLSLSIAEWSLIWFSVIAIAGAVHIFKGDNRNAPAAP